MIRAARPAAKVWAPSGTDGAHEPLADLVQGGAQAGVEPRVLPHNREPIEVDILEGGQEIRGDLLEGPVGRRTGDGASGGATTLGNRPDPNEVVSRGLPVGRSEAATDSNGIPELLEPSGVAFSQRASINAATRMSGTLLRTGMDHQLHLVRRGREVGPGVDDRDGEGRDGALAPATQVYVGREVGSDADTAGPR